MTINPPRREGFYKKFRHTVAFIAFIVAILALAPAASAAGRRRGRANAQPYQPSMLFVPPIPEDARMVFPPPYPGPVRCSRAVSLVRAITPVRLVPAVEPEPEILNHEPVLTNDEILSTLSNMTLDDLPSTEEETVLSTEERRPVLSTEEKPPVLSTEEKPPVLSTEEKPPVVSTNEILSTLSNMTLDDLPSTEEETVLFPEFFTEERRPVLSFEERRPAVNTKRKRRRIVEREADGSITCNYRFVREMEITDAIDQNPRANQLLIIGNQPLEPTTISKSEIWEDFQPNKVDVTKASNRYRQTINFIETEVVETTMELLGNVRRSPKFDQPTKVLMNPRIESWENAIIQQSKTLRSAAKISLDYEITRKETEPWKSHLTKNSDSIKRKGLEKTLKGEYNNTENLLEEVTSKLLRYIAATPLRAKLMQKFK